MRAADDFDFIRRRLVEVTTGFLTCSDCKDPQGCQHCKRCAKSTQQEASNQDYMYGYMVPWTIKEPVISEALHAALEKWRKQMDKEYCELVFKSLNGAEKPLTLKRWSA